MIKTCDFLQNKKILICTSSSIAIYKILDLISQLRKMGAEVKVVMSEEAKSFIAPLCFEALSHHKVLHAQSEDWSGDCNHIGYAQWAEMLLIAPASANSIAKIANGIADNLLLSTILACKARKIIAPAMNTQMLQAPQTQENLRKLQNMGFLIIPTREDRLACNTIGDGALAQIDEMLFFLLKVAFKTQSWEGKKVLITGGGSKEDIDAVRCISNHSSGLQASALAIILYCLGAEVTFISSAFPVALPQGIKICEVKSAKNYLDCIVANLSNQKTYLFMAAAIADFIPKDKKTTKIKKQHCKELHLALEQNLDILASLHQDNLIKIGFKAEFDANNATTSAKEMLTSKQCACVCLNILSYHNAFDSSKNAMILFSKEGQKTLPLSSKLHIAFEIANFTSSL